MDTRMGAGRRLLRIVLVSAAVAAIVRGGDTPSPSTLEPSPLASATGPAVLSASGPPSPTPSPSPSSLSSPPSSPTPSPSSIPTVATVLAGLAVAPEQRTGYKRSLFRLWIDADGNGCNTRQEVLIAEAITAPTVGAKCALSGGEWLSLYDGLTFTDAGKLDIDHMVPLAEAWDSGAFAWTASQRKAFANDLGVSWALIAVSAGSNRSKGDKDPAEWLPPRAAYLCTYLAVWVAIKQRWDLTVDAAEKSAIGAETACQETPVPAP